MSIICTRCGGTQVVCEATINPNTKVITEISDDSLQFGRCETCKVRSVLTDVEKTKAAIKSGFAGFVEANGRNPHYASCRIVWKYTNGIKMELTIIETSAYQDLKRKLSELSVQMADFQKRIAPPSHEK